MKFLINPIKQINCLNFYQMLHQLNLSLKSNIILYYLLLYEIILILFSFND